MDYFNQTLIGVPIWALSDNQDGHQNCAKYLIWSFLTHVLPNIIYNVWTTFIKLLFIKKVIEYDQEIPQSHAEDQLTAP